MERTITFKYLVVAFGQITVARPLVVGVAIGSDRSKRKSNRTCVFHRTCGYMFGQFKLRGKNFGAKRASGCHGGWGEKSKSRSNDHPVYIYIQFGSVDSYLVYTNNQRSHVTCSICFTEPMDGWLQFVTVSGDKA